MMSPISWEFSNHYFGLNECPMNFNLSNNEQDERSLLSSISNRLNLIRLQRQNNVFGCCYWCLLGIFLLIFHCTFSYCVIFDLHINRHTFLADVKITTKKKKMTPWREVSFFFSFFNSTNGLFDLWMASMSKVWTLYQKILISRVKKMVMFQVKTILAYQFLWKKAF